MTRRFTRDELNKVKEDLSIQTDGNVQQQREQTIEKPSDVINQEVTLREAEAVETPIHTVEKPKTHQYEGKDVNPTMNFIGDVAAGSKNTLESYNLFDDTYKDRPLGDQSLMDVGVGTLTGSITPEQGWGEFWNRVEHEPGKIVGEVGTEAALFFVPATKGVKAIKYLKHGTGGFSKSEVDKLNKMVDESKLKNSDEDVLTPKGKENFRAMSDDNKGLTPDEINDKALEAASEAGVDVEKLAAYSKPQTGPIDVPPGVPIPKNVATGSPANLFGPSKVKDVLATRQDWFASRGKIFSGVSGQTKKDNPIYLGRQEDFGSLNNAFKKLNIFGKPHNMKDLKAITAKTGPSDYDKQFRDITPGFKEPPKGSPEWKIRHMSDDYLLKKMGENLSKGKNKKKWWQI